MWARIKLKLYAAVAVVLGALVLWHRAVIRQRDRARQEAERQRAIARTTREIREIERSVAEKQNRVRQETENAKQERATERPTGGFGDRRLHDD